jgi:putative SOS response-associated peptidase YedK
MALCTILGSSPPSKAQPNGSVAPNFEPDWNKPPTAPMLVAIRSVNGERIPKMMKWGLIPQYFAE